MLKLKRTENSKDTLTEPYTGIEYEKKELLNAAPGTKSVLFNSDGSKLYAMNLEGMSVYEFDQPSRTITREFKFKPTKGTGGIMQMKNQFLPTRKNRWKPASAMMIKYYGYRCTMQKVLFRSGLIRLRQTEIDKPENTIKKNHRCLPGKI